MDATTNRRGDIWNLIKGLTVSQKASIALATGFLIGLMGWLSLRGTSSEYVPLTYGKMMTVRELAEAEQALIDANLTDFHRKGQRLYVPKGQVSQYEAALLSGQVLPVGWGSELQKQLTASGGVFESSRVAEDRARIALAQYCQKILEALPGVHRASVAWAAGQTAKWPHNKASTTATVNVLMKRGQAMSPKMVDGIRKAVASMVSGLAENEVTVFDLNTAIAHKLEETDPRENALLRRIEEFRERYQNQIAGALSYIPGVIVAVNIDVDNVKSRVERSREMSKTNTATIAERTTNREESFNQRRIGGEPGVTTNRPQSLPLSQAPEKSGTLKEDTAESTNYPGMTISEQEFFGAMPKAVQVSVSIPESYYEAVALKQGVAAGTTDEEKAAFKAAVANIETEEIQKARAKTTVLIPADSPDAAIVVDSYTTVNEDVVDHAPSFIDGAWGFLRDYGGSLVLLAFAIFALWTLKKQLPEMPTLPEEEISMEARAAEAEPEPEPPAPELVQKQGLQTLVRDNPEATANIIEGWLDEAV